MLRGERILGLNIIDIFSNNIHRTHLVELKTIIIVIIMTILSKVVGNVWRK